MSDYSKLEMCISKEPWKNVLWDATNRTMIMKNATMVHLLLMYMYDDSILKKTELESLKSRYAKVLEIDLSEIDDKLRSLRS